MTEHKASCQCGAVHVHATAGPQFVAACNCIACQKKTGAPLASGVFFKQEDISVSGDTWKWARKAESGNELTQHFCPNCGTTVFWMNSGRDGIVAVSYGSFDGDLPQPDKVIWTENQHDWLSFADGIPQSDRG